MRCSLVFSVLLGCADPPPAAPVVAPKPAPVAPAAVPGTPGLVMVATPPALSDSQQQVDEIRRDLQAAQRLWSDQKRAEAAAAVRRTYQERFEPLEPALRAVDPQGTLSLEYDFGRLARTLSRPGKAAEVGVEVRALGDRLLAAQAGLPVEAPPTPAPGK